MLSEENVSSISFSQLNGGLRRTIVKLHYKWIIWPNQSCPRSAVIRTSWPGIHWVSSGVWLLPGKDWMKDCPITLYKHTMMLAFLGKIMMWLKIIYQYNPQNEKNHMISGDSLSKSSCLVYLFLNSGYFKKKPLPLKNCK
jgi:hypothetical protein